MHKDAFLSALRARLSGLPKEDVEKSVAYYSESIDDRMEDGLTETEAVAAVGTIEEIATQILTETGTPKAKPSRKWKAWEIVLLVLGSPVWLPLVAAAVIVGLAVYMVLWAVVASAYAVVLSLTLGAVAGIFGGLACLFSGGVIQCVLYLGMGLICGGAGVLLLLGMNCVTKGVLYLSKKLWRSVFRGKGDAK